eukprot:gene3549-3886_t
MSLPPSLSTIDLVSSEISTHGRPVKVFCLSDLHADSERNQKWVKEHCVQRASLHQREDTPYYSVLIIPGDVGSEIDRIDQIFLEVKKVYDLVCFLPGNHELWRRGTAAGGSAMTPELRGENRMAEDSVVKMKEVLELAQNCGVYTGPVLLNYAPLQNLAIVPLYAWYHSSWDKEAELTNEAFLEVEEVIPFKRKWGDNLMCSWPNDLIDQDDFIRNERNDSRLAHAFSLLNEPFLQTFCQKKKSRDDGRLYGDANGTTTVISFSHFLPRQELCPEKRFLMEPLLSKVVGSDVLEEQIRRLGSTLHLFGHTHVPIDLELDGIRYIQWPLGYHREADKQCAPVVRLGPLTVFDSTLGTLHNGIPPNLPSLDVGWTRHYRTLPRQPEVVEPLAPWVVSRLESFWGLVYSHRQRAANANANSSS